MKHNRNRQKFTPERKKRSDFAIASMSG